jgi:hypothetical protein
MTPTRIAESVATFGYGPTSDPTRTVGVPDTSGLGRRRSWSLTPAGGPNA